MFLLLEGIQKLSFEEEMVARLENAAFAEAVQKKSNKKQPGEESVSRKKEKSREVKEAEKYFTEASKLKVERKIIK